MRTNTEVVLVRHARSSRAVNRTVALNSGPRKFTITKRTAHKAKPAQRRIPITVWRSHSWFKKIATAEPGSLTAATARILRLVKS